MVSSRLRMRRFAGAADDVGGKCVSDACVAQLPVVTVTSTPPTCSTTSSSSKMP